jgi:hypothetical protein
MENAKTALLALVGMLLGPLVPRVDYADLTNLSQLMKEVYDPVIQEQQNLEPFTWRDFEDGDDKLGGKGWYFETKMGGNQEGIGARLENGDLPTAGFQRWLQGNIYWKLLYGAFELSGPAIEAAKGDLESFANSRTEEIEGLTRDVIKDFNRQIYGDGQGVLATCNGTESGQTLNVYDGMYLRLNMKVSLFTTVPALNGDLGKITALAPQSDGSMKVTYSGTETTALINETIRRTGSTSSDGVTGYEMTGLKQIIDDGTVAAAFEGITRATWPLWNGNVLGNSGTNRNLTLDLLQQAEDAIVEMAGKRPDWIRMNLGQRRKFVDLVSPDRRYASTTFDAGYERLSYNGLTLTVDIDHPKNEITFLTKSSIKKYMLRKFGLIDFDGLVLRQVANKDVWRGYIGMYGNLGSKRPNCNARLTDLQEPAFVARARG